MKKMNRFPPRRQRGFTLIELLMVIAVAVVLAVVIGLSYSAYTGKTQAAVDAANLDTLNQATLRCAIENLKTPAEIFPAGSSETEKMELLVKEKYLTAVLTAKQKDVTFLFDARIGMWYLSNESIGLLYESEFSDNSGILSLIDGWTAVSGKLTHTVNGESRAVFKGSSAADYTITLRATFISGSSSQSGYGVYYRATDVPAITGYCFQFDPGAKNLFTVRKVVNGSEKAAFQSVSMTQVMGASFNIYAPHTVSITVSGSSHTISVDGATVFQFSDSTYASGFAGIRSWNNSKVELDNVKIVKK